MLGSKETVSWDLDCLPITIPMIIMVVYIVPCGNNLTLSSHTHTHTHTSVYSMDLCDHCVLCVVVGSSGCVYSFENSQEHLASAVTNYNNWRQCHELTHPGAHWQDNVMFVNDSVANVTTHVQTPLDAVCSTLIVWYF